MLLGHTKHYLSQPYSPKRVQVFPTNSEGAQGGRPETQNTARHSVKGRLAAWSKQERACRQGSAASVVAGAVLMGALPWQALQHPKGPGTCKTLREWAGVGSHPVPRTQHSLLQGAAGCGHRCAWQACGKLAEMKGALLFPLLRAGAVCGRWEFPCQGLPEPCWARPGSPACPGWRHNDSPASRSARTVGQ